MSKDELTRYLAGKIKYDGSEYQSECICPNCQSLIQERDGLWWITNKVTLERIIAKRQGFTKYWQKRDLANCINQLIVTGDPMTDAKAITDKVWDTLYAKQLELEVA